MTFMGQPLKPRTSVEYIMMSSFHMVPIIQVMDDHDLLVLKQLWRFGDPPVSEPPIYQHQERSTKIFGDGSRFVDTPVGFGE